MMHTCSGPRPLPVTAPLAVLPLCAALSLVAVSRPASGAPPLPRYYGHPAVHDERGVIAPWHRGLDGPCDLRVRIAAETLKRFPWTAEGEAPARAPHYVYTGTWAIAPDGAITPKPPGDWANGDIGQRATNVLEGWVAYYRYSGDGAAMAHLAYMADFILDHCQTPPDHPWPGLFISVPVKGKAYGDCDPHGMIQLDLCASTGLALLHAAQLTGNARWFDAAKRWGDLLARKCSLAPGTDPWPRYANPEDAPWKDDKQTGGVTMILAFLDGLLDMGYQGEGGRIVVARDAGHRHLREVLLPAWSAHDTWGRYFWDWANAVQNCITTPDAARYLMDHRDAFPLWQTDARNLLTLFLHRSCVAPESSGDVYSGAWAYPEASNCCGRSLWYAPLCMAPAFAELATLSGSAWARELTVRQLVLATYDVQETGVSEDGIDGGVVVNGDWLNIAHPLPLRFLLEAMAWLPEELGPSRESRIVRSTSVVDSVVHAAGRIEYSTFDAPRGTVEVLRLAFAPRSVTADGRQIPPRRDLDGVGYTVKALPNGDAIVSIRHDGARNVVVTGDDPQRTVEDDAFARQGPWRREEDPRASAGAVHVTEAAGAAASAAFEGIAVRVIGPVGPDGGLADVELDGVRQLVPIDGWSPAARARQVLYSRSGLAPGPHTIRIAARGAGNPRSAGARVALDSLLWTPAGEPWNFRPAGPIEEQRLVFGRTAREDLVDSAGRPWRPGTEVVMRLGTLRDPVAEAWWTDPAPGPIEGTPDPDLFRHGIHGRDFRVVLTVGPGTHHARIKLAATRGPATANPFTISINGRVAAQDLDVAATAGGPNRAADLIFDGIEPLHGTVEVRFQGSRRPGPDGAVVGEAFVQALEVGPGPGGEGARPVSAGPPPVEGNSIANPGFEATSAGVLGGKGARAELADWTCDFLGPMGGYVWQEADYSRHPEWGLPEIRSGKGALRTHGDGEVATRIRQEVEARPGTRYAASVWVRAADVRGKGFGKDPRDVAAFVVEELDSRGAVLRAHPRREVREAGPYRQLSMDLVAGPDTATIRFALETAIHCRYEEGHVTWDDASLTVASLPAEKPADNSDLEQGFRDPPDAAKPWAYWWWLDGNASREGITRDLEEMRRAGIAGVLLFDAGEGKGSPIGPVFMSPAWRDLFRHAISEAARQGLEVGVNLTSGWDAGGTWVTPEHAAKKLAFSETTVEGPADVSLELPRPEVVDGFYRDIAVIALPKREAARADILHLEIKAARAMIWPQSRTAPWDELPERAGEEDASSEKVVDLTSSLDAEGRLAWKAPPGRWTVLRFGATLLGSKTKCTSPGSQGYEIDFLDAAAMDLHFRETGEKLIEDAGPLAGRTLRYFHDDSYEVGADVGGQQPSWTPRFREEFRARRGYDLLPWMPVLAGKIVDGRGDSNRFLRDFRKTIGDLIAENHYARFRDLSRRAGIGIHPESGGPFYPHIDALQCLGKSDIPMGEFWKRRSETEEYIWYRDHYPLCDTVKQAASAAHIYGKPLCQAEAFTSMGPNWEEDPFDLKDIGDLAFCAGLTRNVLCFYVHQPRLDVKPGYQWEAAGTHFDRNITWWPMIHAWLKYLSRCQFLLARGRFVADVCYFQGEDVPSFVPARTHMTPPLPPGRDCDAINAEALLERMSAREGCLALPDGTTYRLLVLPERRTMSPQVLRKIAELVRAGATVLGSRPERAPGLTDPPKADEEVRRLAADLWGEIDGKTSTEHKVGDGRIIQGRGIEEVLRADSLPPDFECRGQPDARIEYIHRAAPEAEIYFVSNQGNREEAAECAFRVSGCPAEIWDATSGDIRGAQGCRDDGARTWVPMRFAPRQSWFVVFRRPAAGGIEPSSARKAGSSFPVLSVARTIEGPWRVSFDPRWGGPEAVAFERLEDWAKRPEDGIRYYSGTATYHRTFDLGDGPPAEGARTFLDLGTVHHLAAVRLNGKDLGVVWTAPWRVEVTGILRASGNDLEVDVANLWPNRLIGDARLPPEQRFTVTNVGKFQADSSLLTSGLIGPVTLQVEAGAR